MTKPKTGAAAPVEEQTMQDQAVSEDTTAPIVEQPSSGGSYIRNPDGTLTREEEA